MMARDEPVWSILAEIQSPVKQMANTWLKLCYRTIYVSYWKIFGLRGFDDGPKRSSSLLWTLVMRISCFLLLQDPQPIKGIPEGCCLFLVCDSSFVLRQKEFTRASCLSKILKTLGCKSTRKKWQDKRARWGSASAENQRKPPIWKTCENNWFLTTLGFCCCGFRFILEFEFTETQTKPLSFSCQLLTFYTRKIHAGKYTYASWLPHVSFGWLAPARCNMSYNIFMMFQCRLIATNMPARVADTR